MQAHSLDHTTALRIARKRAKDLRHFYYNVAAACGVLPLLWFFNALSFKSNAGWWAIWPTIGWGGSLIVWGLSLAGEGKGWLFGAEWEERKVEELMARHKLRSVARDREAIQAQLRLLQAQIEPHFLFNTLANVQSLIRREPSKAESMLDNFIIYLRQSLSASRATTGTLGQELQLLRTYLDLLKIRMGDRLQYDINVPTALLSLPLSPMLLQPIVENAVRHGLEPKVEGGSINITASEFVGRCQIVIADNGLGFEISQQSQDTSPQAGSSGVGLSNLRERLRLLYGEQASVEITQAAIGAGTVVTVTIPVSQPVALAPNAALASL
jgi:nitrate/nitrite-specific signal transduction histidine kinase